MEKMIYKRLRNSKSVARIDGNGITARNARLAALGRR